MKMDHLEEIAPKLNGVKEGTFVYDTIKDRWTQIVGKIVDHFHCRRRDFMEQYGDAADADVKSINAELSEMRYRMMTDKPLEDFNDDFLDVQMWNEILMDLRDTHTAELVTWYKSDWLFVECYLYRRIFGCVYKTHYLKKYDVFAHQKNEGFAQHANQVTDSVKLLNALLAEGLETDTRRKALEILIKTCLWGNRCDLSLSGGEASVHQQSEAEIRARDQYILVNDTNKLIDLLVALAKKSNGETSCRRLDIVLDNAGMELVGDIVLAQYCLASGTVDKVVFHGKAIPWFVSDVTLDDWEWTLKEMEAMEGEVTDLVSNIRQQQQEGKMDLRFDMFWTSPYAFFEMESKAPALYKDLSESSLIIFKGDLNYRKLTGDRDWDHETPFETALRGFRPSPLVALRTLKAETVVGLDRATVDGLMATFAESNLWLVSGDHAVIQMIQ